MLQSSFALMWRHSIRDGLALVRRKRWVAALITLTAILTLALPLSTEFLQASPTLDMRFELRRGVKDEIAHTFFALLQRLPGVDDAALVTKEQAYEKARMHDPSLIAHLQATNRGNPFPDTIAVSLASLSALSSIEQLLIQPPWSTVLTPDALTQVRERMQPTQTSSLSMQTLLLAFAASVSVAAVLMYMLSEALRDHRAKLLMGASNMTRVLPPVVQMMTLIVTAGALTAGITTGALTLL